MPLSWNEIRERAIAFSREWRDETSEDAEAKSFWDSFFNIFGVSRRRVASFERPIRRPDGTEGYIDLLWKGTLLVEHKSRGRDLERAYRQATDYFYGLKDRDLPRYVLVSDFARFRLYDLDRDEVHEFSLGELHRNVKHFAFIAGYETRRFEAPEEAANIRAAEQLGKLHDLLKANGYAGHPLEVFLVRILFCLFADDTGIFDKHGFREYLELRTNEDGSDLGMHLTQLFQVLNTPDDRRQSSLDEQLASFRYVNGKLFEESLPIPAFDSAMRETLLDASALDWSAISPAIFGSLFQSIMDKEARRNLGAHYTREVNILKALQSLFLDDLIKELVAIGSNKKRLIAFQLKLASIRVFDPACGCGNFLVVAYRELRKLEHEVLRRLHKIGQSSKSLDISNVVFLDVDQFYGIEIEEFPAQIAQAALWLTDHQMNLMVSEEFGQYFARLPLTKAPNIVHGNALTIPWESLIDAQQLTYIVGNPPYRGKQLQTAAQKAELAALTTGISGAGVLDYVSGWFVKAAGMLWSNPRIEAALVTTNSITQGEQVGVLWRALLAQGIRINFAHRTFRWSSEARGRAAVHVVIIGFSRCERAEKYIVDYESPDGEGRTVPATNINPYLVDAPSVLIGSRRQSICGAPAIVYGSMANDDGHLLLSDSEKQDLVNREPGALRWIRPFMQVDEFLYATKRWCLWLVGASSQEIRSLPEIYARVERVRDYRNASERPTTRALANTPTLFGEIRQPNTAYLVIPRHTGEDRRYIPVGRVDPEVICGDANLLIANPSHYVFGIVQSATHMGWVRAVCGRLESRYRYSAGIVYNNFPWPNPTEAQRESIEAAGRDVLRVRNSHAESTLAELYDPIAMPPDLVDAHRALDRAVDAAYGARRFITEADRVAFLFARYQTLVAPLDVSAAPAKRRSRRKSIDDNGRS